MQELDDLLKKYQSLASNPTISFDRLRWGQQDLAGLRDRVHMNMSFLTGFNASLVQFVLSLLLCAGCTCMKILFYPLGSTNICLLAIIQLPSRKTECPTECSTPRDPAAARTATHNLWPPPQRISCLFAFDCLIRLEQ